MVSGILVWIVRISTGLSLFAALLPMVRVGYWFVRLCDFPRLQLAAFAAIPLLIAVSQGVFVGWRREQIVVACLASLVGLWQLSHVVPYTGLWAT